MYVRLRIHCLGNRLLVRQRLLNYWSSFESCVCRSSQKVKNYRHRFLFLDLEWTLWLQVVWPSQLNCYQSPHKFYRLSGRIKLWNHTVCFLDPRHGKIECRRFGCPNLELLYVRIPLAGAISMVWWLGNHPEMLWKPLLIRQRNPNIQ